MWSEGGALIEGSLNASVLCIQTEFRYIHLSTYNRHISSSPNRVTSYTTSHMNNKRTSSTSPRNQNTLPSAVREQIPPHSLTDADTATDPPKQPTAPPAAPYSPPTTTSSSSPDPPSPSHASLPSNTSNPYPSPCSPSASYGPSYTYSTHPPPVHPSSAAPSNAHSRIPKPGNSCPRRRRSRIAF